MGGFQGVGMSLLRCFELGMCKTKLMGCLNDWGLRITNVILVSFIVWLFCCVYILVAQVHILVPKWYIFLPSEKASPHWHCTFFLSVYDILRLNGIVSLKLKQKKKTSLHDFLNSNLQTGSDFWQPVQTRSDCKPGQKSGQTLYFSLKQWNSPKQNAGVLSHT